MSDTITIKTNNHPRDILYGWDLTPSERAEFDYVDWAAVEDGRANAEFVRYRGQLIDVNDTEGIPQFAPGWDAYRSDSFFSGIVLRYPRGEDGSGRPVEFDTERVIVGTYYC